ncbi:hypothetical protein BJ138DRAFT_1069425 [Hygrophoropsis aurantiaca]|uniref:Uncharacterized protein n=1 Tax=Hygrophoropsis aurantiaca TaxID=72124 RepID=A0ACB8A4D1_9AGAM|nr:hypothetical protein BJ138DRAFT_1069425 [Hygrophoropsis aurantiaca]
MSHFLGFAAPQASTSTDHSAMDVDENSTGNLELDSSSVSADPASSLRALALRSRKRRKVAADNPPPLRPVPEPSMQLDYGQDDTEPPSVSPTAAHPVGPRKPSISTPTSASAPNPEIEDGQIREEGEISDTEGTPPPQQRPATPPKKSHQSNLSLQDVSKRTPTIAVSPTRIKTVTSPKPHLVTFASTNATSLPSALEPFILETSTYRLDAQHVRPGLAMTQIEYDSAKDIVLDLLGWGVPPEYLVDCGLSRHVVFYVFSELNLRLPSNLDINGIIQYPTPEMLASIPTSPTISTRSHRSNSSAMPPPSIVPIHGEPSSPIAAARLSHHPHGRDVTSSTDHAPLHPHDSLPESSASSGSSPSLLMIEQQRRQELLARKAAIASRKFKQSDASENDHPLTDGIHEKGESFAAISPVPTETVEDFLKSIEPASDIDIDRVDSVAFIRAARVLSPEHMDVDDMTGYVASHGSDSRALRGRLSGQSSSSNLDADVSIRTDPLSETVGSHPNSAVFSDIAPSTNDSSVPVTPSNTGDAEDPSFSSSHYQNSRVFYDGEGPVPQRRGTKRPVAADFVDCENAPGPSRNHANGYTNGGFAYPIPITRKKTGSFASVSGMRRCVIELSDSDDDGDREEDLGINGEVPDRHVYSPGLPAATLRRNGVGTPGSSSFNGFTARATTPHSTNGSGSIGTQSPAALLEKEQEINLLRQLIAQREEVRQKKLAASGKSTPNVLIPQAAGSSTSASEQPSPLVVSTSTSISVKKEVDDTSPALNRDLSSSSRQSSDASNIDQIPHGAEEYTSMGDIYGSSQSPV